jgi:single-strand DNA-binding protein
MNKVILCGRLTRDPDVRYTQAGKAVTTFTLACDRRSGGESAADFIPVVTWDKLAESCGNYLARGRRVLVEGRLQFRTYSTDGGETRKATEVVAASAEFLDRGKERNEATDAAAVFGKDVTVDWGEEIPF